MSYKLPLIDLEGPENERGLQHGRQAREQILLGIDNYKRAFLENGVGWDRAQQIAGSFLRRLQRLQAPLLEEVRGIATGAGVDLLDILALNSRTEILYEGNRMAKADGCTGVIALPEITSSKHVLHAQNWDWRDECTESTIVLRVNSKGGPRMLIQTEAGVLARCGINDSGVALTANFLRCELDGLGEGVPIPFIRRRILECDNFHSAAGQILRAERSFSSNLMLSSAAGEAADFEAGPKEVFWVMPDDGLLVHANHFVSPVARVKMMDLGLLVTPDSLYRQRRVEAALAPRRGSIDLQALRQALGERTGGTRAVCCHPEPGVGGDTSATVATILMDVTERRMWIAARPYLDDHEYTEYRFD